MSYYYSADRNVQMLIFLLKEHGVKKVVVSPGTSHIPFVASLQQDGEFEMYSEVDERDAAYLACGLSMESGEPVVITCTCATASRNYIPGLTEAFYRKLPIIAITASQGTANAGHLIPQFVDLSAQLNDLLRSKVELQEIKDEKDEWDCNVKINRALLEAVRHGGGPVLIGLQNMIGKGLNTREIAPTRVIRRYYYNSELPELPAGGRIAVTVGVHKPWSKELTNVVDRFCAEHNAVVFVDHSSGYHGKYRVLPTLATAQENYETSMLDTDLLIHIGEQSGDYYTFYKLPKAKEVWRVSPDGEVRDTFRRLSSVFEMEEQDFFSHYIGNTETESSYYQACMTELEGIYNEIPDLPLSNVWLAKEVAPLIPKGAVIQLGVSNTMRSWTFFDFPSSVMSIANTGCRGIDGTLSAVTGMSFANKSKIHYCVLGDLTFFYNMNALGNRQIGNNLRILLVNNGVGAEFELYQHSGHRRMGSDVDPFVAARGHFGNKSSDLVRHYAEDLGFEYMTASTKEEATDCFRRFLSAELTEKPMLFEVFTSDADESDALKLIRTSHSDSTGMAKSTLKQLGRLAKKITQ